MELMLFSRESKMKKCNLVQQAERYTRAPSQTALKIVAYTLHYQQCPIASIDNEPVTQKTGGQTPPEAFSIQ